MERHDYQLYLAINDIEHTKTSRDADSLIVYAPHFGYKTWQNMAKQKLMSSALSAMKFMAGDVTDIQHPLPNVTSASSAQKPFSSTLATLGPNPDSHQTIFNVAMNGSGYRDTARAFGINLNTVLRHLKKFRQNR